MRRQLFCSKGSCVPQGWKEGDSGLFKKLLLATFSSLFDQARHYLPFSYFRFFFSSSSFLIIWSIQYEKPFNDIVWGSDWHRSDNAVFDEPSLKGYMAFYSVFRLNHLPYSQSFQTFQIQAGLNLFLPSSLKSKYQWSLFFFFTTGQFFSMLKKQAENAPNYIKIHCHTITSSIEANYSAIKEVAIEP